MTPKTYTVRETARIFGYSLEHVYKLIWAGKLPAGKGSNGWRITQASIDIYRNEHAR